MGSGVEGVEYFGKHPTGATVWLELKVAGSRGVDLHLAVLLCRLSYSMVLLRLGF